MSPPETPAALQSAVSLFKYHHYHRQPGSRQRHLLAEIARRPRRRRPVLPLRIVEVSEVLGPQRQRSSELCCRPGTAPGTAPSTPGNQHPQGQCQVVAAGGWQIHIERRWRSVVGVVDARQPRIQLGIAVPASQGGSYPAIRHPDPFRGIGRGRQHIGVAGRVDDKGRGVAEVKSLLKILRRSETWNERYDGQQQYLTGQRSQTNWWASCSGTPM